MQAKPLALPAAILLGAWLTACGGGRPDSNGFFAANDTATTTPSTSVTIDVLANDSADALLDNFQSTSSNGVVVRDDSGTSGDTGDDKLVYTPSGGFEGVDTFTYSITDAAGNNTRTATVTVTVSSTGQALDDAKSVEKDSSDNDIPVLDNDSPGMKVTSIDTADTETGASVNIAAGGNSILYTPPAGFTGEDYFSYTAERTVNGKVEADTADVTITVQEPAQPTMACGDDIESRLAAGQGYCYAAKLVRTVQGKDIQGNTVPEEHILDFTVFVPHPDKLRANAIATGATLAADEPGFAPLLIHSHGFGSEKYADFSDPKTFLDSHIAKLAWEAGYFVITYTQRGFGGPQGGNDRRASGSTIGMMRPDLEGFDFVDLVNWSVVHLREHFNFDDPFLGGTDTIYNDEAGTSHTDPNTTPEGSWGRSLIMTDSLTRLSSVDGSTAQGNPALATIGYSWGGIFQFVGQSVDTRVDAIIPMGTGFDLRYTLAPNDTPKTTWITIMTAFATDGGNGEPLPKMLTDGNTESNGANASLDDSPHNKPRQISIKNYRKLGPNGTIAYCDGNQGVTPDPGFLPFADGDELTDTAQTPPPNATTDRAARAHLFMIQGYGDTLFNFNEGYDNARCFAELAPAGTDVRLLEQTSGHPLPGLGPTQYAGAQRSMYMDEVVHCGLEGGVPRRYVMRDVGLDWLNFHLRGILPAGAADVDDIFPRACIVQENTDTSLQYKTGDSHPEYSGTNDFDFDSPGLPNPNSYKFPREGVVFDALSDIPRGCSGAASDCLIGFTTDDEKFESESGFPGKVTTGPSPDPNGSLRPAQFLPLYDVTSSRVMAGIPLINMTVSRDNPTQEEIFFVGIGIRRADSATPELLHFQAAPIRIFPSPEAAIRTMALPPEDATFPLDEPRNGNAMNAPHYPIRFGANPGFAGNTDTAKGRLPGVSARLLPGDQVGLMFFAEHPVYKSISSPAAGTVSVVGSIELPLLDPSTAPDNIPAYVENTSAP